MAEEATPASTKAADPAPPPTPGPTPAPAPTPQPVRWPYLTAVAAFAALLIGAAVGHWWTSPPGPTPMPAPPIVMPEKIQIDPAAPLARLAPVLGEGTTGLVFLNCPTNCCLITEPIPEGLLIIGTRQGESIIGAVAVNGGKIVGPIWTRITVGPPIPPTPPTPPVPPVPPVPPTPPTPPAPIPDAGLHVLIKFETADLSKYPPAQALILTAQPVRDYLASKCAKDGSTPAYRIYDKDVDTTAEAPWLKAAMQIPAASLPWIVISDGKTGVSQPLPATVDDTLALLKKYGG